MKKYNSTSIITEQDLYEYNYEDEGDDFMLSNKAYDILVYICQIFLPALITLYGVIGVTCNIPYTEQVLTIATAFNVFLGTCLKISNANYKKGVMKDEE
jgi:hypothetical protein